MFFFLTAQLHIVKSEFLWENKAEKIKKAVMEKVIGGIIS